MNEDDLMGGGPVLSHGDRNSDCAMPIHIGDLKASNQLFAKYSNYFYLQMKDEKICKLVLNTEKVEMIWSTHSVF